MFMLLSLSQNIGLTEMSLALYAFVCIPQWMNRVFSENLSAFMVTDIPRGIFHTSRVFLDKVCKFVHR